MNLKVIWLFWLGFILICNFKYTHVNTDFNTAILQIDLIDKINSL